MVKGIKFYGCCLSVHPQNWTSVKNQQPLIIANGNDWKFTLPIRHYESYCVCNFHGWHTSNSCLSLSFFHISLNQKIDKKDCTCSSLIIFSGYNKPSTCRFYINQNKSWNWVFYFFYYCMFEKTCQMLDIKYNFQVFHRLLFYTFMCTTSIKPPMAIKFMVLWSRIFLVFAEPCTSTARLCTDTEMEDTTTYKEEGTTKYKSFGC